MNHEQDAPQFNLFPTTREKALPDGRTIQFIIWKDEDNMFRAWITAYRYDDRANPVYTIAPFKTSGWSDANTLYNSYFNVKTS